MKNTLIAGLMLAITASLSHAAGDEWMTDFEAAKKKAAAENKSLLVDFTGSDWCGWCIKLVDEVFKHDAFKEGVADKFVLVELDYPRDKSKLSEETQKQNEELKAKYSIRGYPTILLLDSDGRPFAQTGYQAGGPEKYLAHLDSLLAIKTKRDEAFSAAEKLEGKDKAEALVATLKMLPEGQLSHYSETTQQIAALDPEDESGFIAAQKRKEAESNLQSEYMAAMQSGKNDEAMALIDQFIADYKITGTEKQSALGMKMNPLLASKQFDEAAELLDEIVAIAPESRIGKFASDFKPKLEEMKQEAAKPNKNPAHGQPGHVCDEHD
jgi:thioredoxin-related protein